MISGVLPAHWIPIYAKFPFSDATGLTESSLE
jgi:hypothetical protein